MAVVKQGYKLPPVAPAVPPAYELAWLALLPTTSPALTTDEQARVRSIKNNASDSRVVARAAAILTANGTP
jgi:hypothetical protein